MTTDPRAFSSYSSSSTAVPPWLSHLPARENRAGWGGDRGEAGVGGGGEDDCIAIRCHRRTRPPPARRRTSSTSSYSLSPQPQCSSKCHDGSMAGRRRRRQRHASFVGRFPFLVTLLVLMLLSPGASATAEVVVYGASEIFPAELLFDRSPPPLPRAYDLERRQEGDATSTAATAALPSVTVITISDVSAGGDGGGATTTTTAAISASNGLATASPTASAALPRPFDSSLGNNFTSSTCPIFFQGFLNNQTFSDCHPLSLLLQTSNSFFTASRSLVRLTQTLDATCNVNVAVCSALMAELADAIQQEGACAADLAMQNPMATQAYNGFRAYPTLYRAGCLTNAGTGNFCFADAATNASAPASSYIYYLPLAVALPGGSRPACTACLQNTMALFADDAAANATSPLRSDYVAAAQQIQMDCGPSFVEASVPSSAPAMLVTTSYLHFAGLLIALAVAGNWI